MSKEPIKPPAVQPPVARQPPTEPALVAPPPAQKALFKVPPEMTAGVYREDVGHFKPGMEFTLPDAASPTDEQGNLLPEFASLKLIPMNEAAVALLQATKRFREQRLAEGTKRIQQNFIPEPKPLGYVAPVKAKTQAKGLGVQGAREADK